MHKQKTNFDMLLHLLQVVSCTGKDDLVGGVNHALGSNVTLLRRILIRTAKADVLHWESGRAETTLQLLLGMVSHYLQPSLPDAQCYAVGQLLSAMLRHLKEAMLGAVSPLCSCSQPSPAFMVSSWQ